MKVILTVVVFLISAVLVAQNNVAPKQVSNSVTSGLVPASEKNSDKKVHYVEKRTKPVQNNSRGNSNSQMNKKPVVRKSENKGKLVSK